MTDKPAEDRPAPDQPAADAAAAAPAAPAEPGEVIDTTQPRPRRGILAWLRSRAARALAGDEVPAEPAAKVPPIITPEEDRNTRLLRMSPFSIGFFGAVGVIVAIGLGMAFLAVKDFVLIIVMSLFLALGLNPIVDFLARRLKRGIAVGIVALLFAGIVAAGMWALSSVVGDQVTNLSRNAPAYLEKLRNTPAIAQLDERFHIVQRITDAVSNQDFWSKIGGGLFGTGQIVFSALLYLIIAIVLTLYFLASLPSIKEVIYQLAPASRRPRVRYLANEMFRRIGGYLTGMFVVVTCAATCAFIMMNIVGLGKYAFALAFVVALFAFIPLVGSTCSMIIIALVALSVSWQTAVIVIIYFLLYQQFEAYVIQPRVMARSVNVPGAVTVVAAIAGGSLFGVPGALVAVPTAAALLLLYREVLIPHLDRT